MKRNTTPGIIACIIACILFFISCTRQAEKFPPVCGDGDSTLTTVKVVATGLNDPRGLKFGPDGYLYVAEAGIGGTHSVTSCMQVVPPVGPYLGSDTGSRISKIDWQGNRITVSTNLPSSITAPAAEAVFRGLQTLLLSGTPCTG